MDTCGDTLPPATHGPGGRDIAFPSTYESGSRGTWHRAVGGTGRPLGKTFFLQCQRRHPELPKIPTYLPALSPVLAQRLLVWPCCALWLCLCAPPCCILVARVVRCSGVLCWRACVVSARGAFRGRLVAGWCLMLLPVFLSVSCPLWSSGGVCCRQCPSLAAWPAALSSAVVCRGALLPCAVSCGAVCPCGAMLWCPAVILVLLSAFVCSFCLFCFASKILKNDFPSLKIGRNHTVPNTRSCNKTTNIFLTCM